MDITLLPQGEGVFGGIQPNTGMLPTSGTFADIAVSGIDLLTGNELESAILMSIFTHRRAADDDVIPLNGSKRGWWADTFNTTRNDKIGSRLWLLQNAKMTQTTLNTAREYVLEALRWIVEDNIASALNVITEFYSREAIAIGVTITKPNGSQSFNYRYVWDQI